MKNGGGHFAPKLGGHFELESGGHFKLELGGQYHWNLQFTSTSFIMYFTSFNGISFFKYSISLILLSVIKILYAAIKFSLM